jgi:prepilin-type N-terminal cleavage/methylation domain-containing protein/prepilin-type processing-associated H-X9-DG protein
MRTSRAFTLVELLVVIVIIALLAVMVVTVAGPFQRKAQMAQAVASLKQLGSGLLNYTTSHDGEFPPLGEEQPQWGAVSDQAAKDAWYNSVPELGGGRALASFERPEEFYHKNNLLFIPAAKYPVSKSSRPYFAVAINEKLYPKRTASQEDSSTSSVRLQNMLMASKTVVFFESGLPDEKALAGQQNYKGNSSGWVSSVAARYGITDSKSNEDSLKAQTNIIFGDGHVETLSVDGVLDPKGGAHYPQLEQDDPKGGKVSWTLDPEANPNG